MASSNTPVPSPPADSTSLITPAQTAPITPTLSSRSRAYISQPVVASFIAGGIAGAVSRTVVSPLERLKILFQIQSNGRTEYKMSVSKALIKMWKDEGWRGFMRGNGTNCIRIVPYSAVQFGSYNFYKRFFEGPGEDISKTPIRRLVCGGLAGITSVTFTYPLDIVRTRLSIQSAGFASLSKAPSATSATSTAAAGAVSSSIPSSSIPHSSTASRPSTAFPSSTSTTSAKASMSTASALSASPSPSTPSSTSPRSPPQQLPGMWLTMKNMYLHEGGLRALYRGILPTVAGVAPYVGLNFMVYEQARQALTPADAKNPSTFGKLAAGAISGAIAQTCTYPFDVLRRRFQINTMSGMGYQYKSIWDALKTIVAQEGMRGLYKGIYPNLLKVAPSMASSWASFEITRDFFVGLKNEESDGD